MSRIGESIKNLRTKKGFSQKQLAKKIGVAESFVNEIELGRKVVNEATIARISKVLGEDLNDINMFSEEMAEEKNVTTEKKQLPSFTQSSKKKEEVNEVWGNAFGNILKDVPLYNYNMNKVLDKIQLPIVSNKVKGFATDKVFFLKIEDNDMSGFRILKDDIAFCHNINDVINNAFIFIEHKGERKVRQIKRLDGNKFLLIANSGAVTTETVTKNEIKLIGKLEYVELKL
ncbi:MAG: S24 family peptidase [Clostridiaceae bacterium]